MFQKKVYLILKQYM